MPLARIVTMTTPLLVLLAVVITVTGYTAGRLHQWYRTTQDRDEAYREGYDTATRSTLSLAARLVGPRRDRAAVRASAAPPHTPSVLSHRSSGAAAAAARPAASAGSPAAFFAPSLSAGAPSDAARDPAASDPAAITPSSDADAARPGRHLVPDELVRAATYRLAPDRVARAKVHGTAHPADDAGPAAHRTAPKPRSS
jgi:hypothetical protein